jgi:hypothetical protein
MDILNAPSREVSCVRRDRTNTPLQALVTLNDPAFVEAARQLAARPALGRRTTFDARLDHVSLRLLGRTLAADERAVVKTLVDDALAVYQRTPAKPRNCSPSASRRRPEATRRRTRRLDARGQPGDEPRRIPDQVTLPAPRAHEPDSS